MSSKKEDKALDAADRIKAAALSAAKGLSRTQAERAAAAAARNVNAYGQKEEGPSRWQERKEAKRLMYEQSTEKAVRLGVKKEIKIDLTKKCQKCCQVGHWTFECKNERIYIARPSRSQILKNPKLMQKMMASYDADNPDTNGAGKVENEENKLKRVKKSKRKHRSDMESSSDTDASDSDSGSRSSSASGSDYSSEQSASSHSSSDSEADRKRKKYKRKQKGRRKKYSSSSESSDYDSSSDSDSGKDRRKSKKSSRRR